ncbi:MAG TPA: translation initiation factor IF-2 [Candidatus Saccharimonadales bacterium]|nr:translation initiation factor IF-2 [Candidatus Saccharimonadales bacterium]
MAETTEKSKVEIAPIIGVGEFAEKLGVPVTKVIGELMKNGVMATINEQIDFDTASIIGSDLGFEVVAEPVAEVAAPVKEKLPEGEGTNRPPVVAVMGHVDHGKTSLLDAIRKTEVAAGESGGITQHIGAYQIKRGERWITFLDTPGHEAFSAIRAHGARMTDVAIIVVAADDGVKPQTKEAIKHAQEAGVQMVVAINKVDKEGADTNRVRQELSDMQLIPEEWGGKTVMVDVSAKSGQNLEKLLDMVLLVADLEDLRARPDGLADGMIIESHLETGRGPVATVLVQNGQLKVGDYIGAGGTYAKVRSLDDWHGKRIRRADPGMPAVVTGFKAVPAFGDVFKAVETEKEARDLAVGSQRQASIKSMVKVKKIDAAELTSAITAGNVSELNVVVKADVQGSLESLLDSLAGLKNEEVAIKVVQSGIGDISESDVTFAKAGNAMILGFNVSMGSVVKQLANREHLQIRLYKVIYELLDDLRDALSQMMKPEIIEHEMGKLKVLGVFKTTKTHVICGGEVTTGKVTANAQVRILRDKQVIGTGKVDNVQKEQNVVKEAVEGEQCGMNLTTDVKIQIDDRLEFYTTEEKARSL